MSRDTAFPTRLQERPGKTDQAAHPRSLICLLWAPEDALSSAEFAQSDKVYIFTHWYRIGAIMYQNMLYILSIFVSHL